MADKTKAKSEDFWKVAREKVEAFLHGTDEVGHFLQSLKVNEEEVEEI